MRSSLLLLFRLAMLQLFAIDSFAQPTHDNPCGAISLPVIESADACSPTRVSFNGATYTAYQINGTVSCSRSFATDPDIWYKFTATKAQLKLSVVPAQGGTEGCANYGISAAEFIILSGNCSGPFTYVACGRSDNANSLTLSNLAIGTEYYIKISSGFGYTCGSLGVCVYTGFPASSAKVGINTNLPGANFDVAGESIFRNNANFYGDIIANKIVSPNLNIAGNIETVDNVTIQSTLTVGNTATIGGPITVGGVADFGGQITAPSLSLGSQIGSRIGIWGNLNSNHYGIGVQSSLLQIYSDAVGANIAFGYGSSNSFIERARIINQGEMGMSLTGRIQLRTGTQSSGLWLNNTANTASTAFIGLASDNQVGFYGPGGAQWGLSMNTTTGNVGIGLNGAAAQVPLQFSNALGLTKISFFRGIYGDIGIGAYGGELRLQNDIPGGKVSFGVLETTGAYTELAKAQRNGAFAFSIFGSLWANGTTYASDGRFKKNIEPLQESLDKVLQLQGVSYEMKTDEFPQEHFDSGTQVGLIAQEVEKIVPEVVTQGPNGYKAIDYAKLVPLLIESIKAQQEMLLKQQAEIDGLKKNRKRN